MNAYCKTWTLNVKHEELSIDQKDPDGNLLYIDAVWIGNKNADKLREQNRAKEQRARNNLTQRAIATLVRNRVTAVLQGRSKLKSSLELTGVRSWQDLRNTIEEQFQDGMTWENWSKEGWHIDHVRPIASFDLNDTKQHKTCFNWRNLQPLLGAENLQKLDKYTKEDEEVWIKRMRDLGFEGELFTLF